MPRVFLRHAEPHQCAEDAAGRRAEAHPRESRGQDSAGEHGTEPGNQERAEQSDQPAHQPSAHRAPGGAFRRLASRIFEQVALLDPLLHGDADPVVREARIPQVADGCLRRGAVSEEPDDGAAGGFLRSDLGVGVALAHGAAPPGCETR
jgi:hypothetical protein